jgi:MtN3 and saliva related transmembrane protein
MTVILAQAVSSGFIEIVGFSAGALTAVAFAPQALQTWRTRKQGMSSGTLLIYGSGVALWLGYGLLIGALPVIVSNAFSLLPVIAIAIIGRRR